MPRPASSSEHLYLLDTLDDHQTAILKLLSEGQNNVFIFSRDLNSLLFNHAEVVDEISRIARRTPSSDVRLLIQNPQVVVEADHKLLRLAQRLSSRITIQKLTIDPPNNQSFMVIDDDKLWLQHDENIITGENTGFMNTKARAEAKSFTQTFKDLWRYSESDVRLRRLSL